MIRVTILFQVTFALELILKVLVRSLLTWTRAHWGHRHTTTLYDHNVVTQQELHKSGSRPLYSDDELRMTIHIVDYFSQKLNQQYHLYVAPSSKMLAIHEQPLYIPNLPYPKKSKEPVTSF